MYNSKSINDGIEFIDQANTRTSKTSNKFKSNKYNDRNIFNIKFKYLGSFPFLF